MSPWIQYTLARLGIFSVALVLLLLTGTGWLLGAIFATLISLALSVLLLSELRQRVARDIQNRIEKATKDVDCDAEDNQIESAKGSAKKPRSSAAEPSRCARIAASASSGRPVKIAMTMVSCCSLEWARLGGNNGISSSTSFTLTRDCAIWLTREFDPAISAIMRCSRESRRR